MYIDAYLRKIYYLEKGIKYHFWITFISRLGRHSYDVAIFLFWTGKVEIETLQENILTTKKDKSAFQ